MHCTMRVSIAAALAGALALAALDRGPAQAASARKPQAGNPATIDLSARRRHHRYYRHHRNRAALRAFGFIAGTIASIAAAEAARRDCRRYGYCYGYYGYGPPPYYYRHGYGYYYYRY